MPTLEDVLRDFEKRIEALEKKLGSEAPTVSRAATAETGEERQRHQPGATSVAHPPYQGWGQSSLPKRASNESSGAQWLAWIGLSFVCMAAVFFLKLTLDSGWLTPPRQVLLAALFGACCLLGPHVTAKASAYGSLLSGAGVVILHLTWMGATFWHQLMGPETAIVVASLVGILALLVNLEFGHRGFVLLAIAGTYLAGPLMVRFSPGFTDLPLFFSIWALSFSALALTTKRRELLLYGAFFAVLSTAFTFPLSLGAGPLLPIFYLQLAQFFFFGLGLAAFSLWHRTPMSQEEAWATALVLLVFYAHFQSLVRLLFPSMAWMVGAGLGLTVLSLVELARKFLKGPLPSAMPLQVFGSAALAHSVYFELLPESYQPLASIVLALVTFFIGHKESAYRGIALVTGLVTLYGGFLVLEKPDEVNNLTFLVYNILFGSLALLGAAALKRPNRSAMGPLLLLFGHLQMLLGVYRLSLSLETGGALFVSFFWGAYAVLVLLRGLQIKDKAFAQSALAILFAVSMKAVFYDLWNTGNLVRVLSLLVAGLVLYGCGWLYQRTQQWPPT